MGLDHLLVNKGLWGVLDTLEKSSILRELEECLTHSPVSERPAQERIARSETLKSFACHNWILVRDFQDYQVLYDMEMNHHCKGSPWITLSYDNLYSCYSATMGALISGCFLLMSNFLPGICLMVAIYANVTGDRAELWATNAKRHTSSCCAGFPRKF
jgi:hypothetical protein